MYFARISLLLLVSGCLLAQAIPDEELNFDELQAYQNIDGYLKVTIENCSSELDFMQQAEQSLAKALEAISIVQVVPDKTQFDEPDLAELTKNKVTIKMIRPILHNLLLASSSCDQDHIDLFYVVSRYITGQLVKEFAQSKINRCWRDQVESVSRLVVSKLYKDNSSVFEFIDQLTSTAVRIKARTQVNSIQINGEYQQPSVGQTEDMLKIIDSAKAVQDPKLHFLKRALDSLFLDTLGSQDLEDVYGRNLVAIKSAKRDLVRSNLIEPCGSVIGRYKQLQSTGNHYDESLLQSSFDDIVAERAETDRELARVLLYLEVCKRAVSKAGTELLMDSV